MILCSGENLIDFVPNSKDSDFFKACVGGSPLNTAIGLGSLNTPVYFFSRISNDFFGKNIINFLKKNKVDTSLVQKTSDKTTLGFISNKKKPEFSFYANKTADRNLTKYSFNKSIKAKCGNNKIINTYINANISEASINKIKATPTFVLGKRTGDTLTGTKIEGSLPWERFSVLIQQHIDSIDATQPHREQSSLKVK